MVTGEDIKDTVHALVADMEANSWLTTDEQAFCVAYHAALNAGATTKADDQYFFCYLLKRFLCDNVNYGALGS
jgi:protein associated with RNAse G/E